MNSVLCESVEGNDELFYINNNKTANSLFDYNNTCMEDLYVGSRCLDRLSECSSEEEEFDYRMLPLHAPPPSPQETPMLDMIFSSQLTSSLEQVISNNSNINNNNTRQQHHHHHHYYEENEGIEEDEDLCASPTDLPVSSREMYSDPMKHAQTLDKLLRRTHHQQQGGHIRKSSHSSNIMPLHTRSKSSDFIHKRSHSKPTSPVKEEFFTFKSSHHNNNNIINNNHTSDNNNNNNSNHNNHSNNNKNNNRLSWYARARKQKLDNIAKAADIAEKLKKALEDHIVDEKTKTLITELQDMGL